MARYYDEAIQVVCDGNGTPVRFRWQGRMYQVRAVLTRWHLRDRWWAAGSDGSGGSDGSVGAGVAGGGAATDRFYWRLHCASQSAPMVFCVIYHDAALASASGSWRLERVYD